MVLTNFLGLWYCYLASAIFYTWVILAFEKYYSKVIIGIEIYMATLIVVTRMIQYNNDPLYSPNSISMIEYFVHIWSCSLLLLYTKKWLKAFLQLALQYIAVFIFDAFYLDSFDYNSTACLLLLFPVFAAVFYF